MRATTLALALTALTILPAQGFADAIADCNSDQSDTIISGCTQLIKSGKTNKDALAIAYFNRGNAYDDNGDHDGAIADYTASIKLKADYTDSYFNRGFSYEAKKDYDNAIADYTRVIALDPQYAKAYYSRARAYQAKGDLKQALAGYEEAAKLAPDNQAVQKKIAEVKQLLGQ